MKLPTLPLLGTRAPYFDRALKLYFAAFAVFAILSWILPDNSEPLIFISALIGSWSAIGLVWLYSEGKSSVSWLRQLIVSGIVIDILFNLLAGRSTYFPILAAPLASIGNLGVLMFAIGLGLAVARGLQKPNYLVLAAIVGALTDIFSVYAGPTKHLIGSSAFGYLSFAWPLVGAGGVQGIVGVGDFVFLTLFFDGARRFKIDDRVTLCAMCAAMIVGFAFTWITQAGVPALPFFAVALLLAHGRELKAQM